MLIDGYMVETSDEKWKWNAAMRCREVDNEAMRHVKDVKSQFDTFTREILHHKEKKNGDCTGNEGDPAFKSFLDKDKSTRDGDDDVKVYDGKGLPVPGVGAIGEASC